VDGLRAPLIIRAKKEVAKYDEEIVMTLAGILLSRSLPPISKFFNILLLLQIGITWTIPELWSLL
jgi:hypothetical protein